MDVPGYVGYPLLGDKSLEFVRSPRDYIGRQRKAHGDVFKARLMNKPHVFLTSNSAVEDFLTNKSSHFELAYKLYLRELFDGVLVFLEGSEWREARRLLEGAFSRDSVMCSLGQVKSLIQRYIGKMKTSEPVEVYSFFKEMATHLSIALFLSWDIDEDSVRDISALMTTHWRGIISVPLPIAIPLTSWRSGYSRALAAKEQLLDLIMKKLESGGVSNIASEVGGAFSDRRTAAQHLLLFVSALLPKAVASLLTSAVIELSKSENEVWRDGVREDNSAAEQVILEVQRLWPPFFGGARVCTEGCEVGGYQIPKGTSVAYISYTANRDPQMFPHPDTFRPERWNNENSGDKERMWTFGGGVRKCIGNFLSNAILKDCLQELCRTHHWELVPGQDLQYKTLPVSRPKSDIQAVFTRYHTPPSTTGQ